MGTVTVGSGLGLGHNYGDGVAMGTEQFIASFIASRLLQTYCVIL